MNDFSILLPPAPAMILQRLHAEGYESFVVGGCVRDALLGRTPHDWDITTNASPQQVIDSFPSLPVIPTGLQHGTVTVIIDHEPYEITTYRVEGDYSDHRRPDKVSFTTSLRDDLARRDFTMNALAYHPELGLQDFFHGVEDLKQGTIRAVGDPTKRFQEDALRILRCLRFASQLDFSIEAHTASAMLQQAPSLDFIAAERIQEELNKALVGPAFSKIFLEYAPVLFQIIPELKPLYGFQQNTPYHIYDVYTHTLLSVNETPAEVTLRLAMLLHDVGKPECYAPDEEGIGHFPKHAQRSKELARTILGRLRYSNERKKEVLTLIEFHGTSIFAEEKNIRQWLHLLGKPLFQKLLQIQRADAMTKAPRFRDIQLEHHTIIQQLFEKIVAEGQCYSMEQLALNGSDLIQIGVPPGPLVGSVLKTLLQDVIDGKYQNEKTILSQKVNEILSVKRKRDDRPDNVPNNLM